MKCENCGKTEETFFATAWQNNVECCWCKKCFDENEKLQEKLSFEQFNKEINPDPLTDDMIDEMYILYAEYLKGVTIEEILDSIVEGTVFDKYLR